MRPTSCSVCLCFSIFSHMPGEPRVPPTALPPSPWGPVASYTMPVRETGGSEMVNHFSRITQVWSQALNSLREVLPGDNSVTFVGSQAMSIPGGRTRRAKQERRKERSPGLREHVEWIRAQPCTSWEQVYSAHLSMAFLLSHSPAAWFLTRFHGIA